MFIQILSNNLKSIGINNVPEKYKEIAQKKIQTSEELKIGKIKYNDKVLHQSKIIKFYVEKKVEKNSKRH